MVDIRTLAHQLGVSAGTVSRALSGRGRVSPATRERVLAAAQAAGYQSNAAAQSLRTGTTGTIGFMMDSGVDMDSNGDTFTAGIFEGLKEALAARNLDLLVFPRGPNEDPVEMLQRIVQRRFVDGIILSSIMWGDPRIALLKAVGLPFVTLGRAALQDDHDWVDLDVEGVAGMAVDRLVAHGHRRIAVALPRIEFHLGRAFLTGYETAMVRHGLAIEDELVLRVFGTDAGGYELGSQLLSMARPPTAIVLNYELLATGLYRRLNEAGVAPGRDLAIIGYRHWQLSKFLSPTLTSFKLSPRELGCFLARRLLALVPEYATPDETFAKGHLWPMTLVPMESDSYPPATTPWKVRA